MNAGGNSPVKVHLLKKHCRPVIYSSDEDVVREAEVLSKENTPSGSSHRNSFSTGLSPQNGEQSSIIIDMTHLEGCDSLWNSDEDEQKSEMSTPAYKRGHYDVTLDNKGNTRRGDATGQAQDREDRATTKVIKLIQEEGMHFTVPSWIQKRKVTPSILVLADAQLKYWPPHDNVCEVVFHQNWPLKRWSQAIQLGTINVKCVTIVLYLEGTCRWSDVPPIKNVLHTLCKTLRITAATPGYLLPTISPGSGRTPSGKIKSHNPTTPLDMLLAACAEQWGGLRVGPL